ncbi:glycerol-3-phosphate dehydrogenase subunit GlpB [Aliiruegeria lutimaris]|uniref:Glycerol 3-phosphate dehydrogenase (Quinone) subunit B n=1 Tax=Aliiruegeria lutimaris TaxID=571298 RepID=A0A1G9ADJ8_9RHOB|nr:glycerol-3-phosphate dehydrogenase subunit GlpB [Aliiruegeria lutimaris]SDK24884.1 glycerol 3-phosphate dehydrogenase (quinone) subunit B [Aliiruegeria lutimaris]
MKRGHRRIETQLAVIGTGIAGFAASIFALKRGLDVAQFGHSGAMAYTTGYLDLLGVHGQRIRQDPWAALDELRRDEPQHPMSKLSNPTIRTAFDGFTDALCDMGIGYTKAGEQNLSGLLPNGVAKPTLSVPKTMLPGIAAREAGARTLVLDFDGLQGFSAKAFEVNFAERWPALKSARLTFPDMENRQVFPEVLARSLENRATQEALAGLIRPLLNGAEYVGVPAILGMHAPDEIRARMEHAIGATLFEIPTIPPAVPGIRLRECFERAFPDMGVKLEPQLKVSNVEFGRSGATLFLHGPMEDLEIEASAVLLATGRFLSGGLKSDQHRLSEPLLDLPILQPDGRQEWFRHEYLDPRGHPINRLGIEVDSAFRPVMPDGDPVNERLFAAGAILAHQDWVRQRSGAGLAIATAYAATEAAAAMLA